MFKEAGQGKIGCGKFTASDSEESGENMLATQNNDKASAYQKSEKQVNTAKEVAKIAGVSHDTIHRVEVRIGELLKQIPKATNGGANQYQAKSQCSEIKQKPKSQVIKENGLTQRQAEHFQIMADNPDSAARAKEKARWSKRPK